MGTQISNHWLPQTLCLISQTLCGTFVIYYISKNKKQYPLQQNSPILIIYAQIMLIVSAICLVAAKLLTQEEWKNFDHFKDCDYKNGQYLTYWSLVYTFSLEFIVFTYLLRLLRVLIVYSNFSGRSHKIIYRIFKNEHFLALIATMWGFLIVGLNLSYKYYHYCKTHNDCKNYESGKWFTLFPQINQFMCDQASIVKADQPFIVWSLRAKLGFYFLLYFLLYYSTKKVNEHLSFRIQYNLLLFLKQLTRVVRIFIQIFGGDQVRSVIVIHYLGCLTNLAGGYIFMWLYCRKIRIYKKFDMMTHIQLGGQIKFLVNYRPIQKSFSKYLSQNNQSKLLKLYLIVNRIPIYYIHQNKQFLKKVAELFEKIFYKHEKDIEYRAFYLYKEMKSIKNNKSKNIQIFSKQFKILENFLNKMLEEWKTTSAYSYIEEECKKNYLLEEKMIMLGLCDKHQ